MTDNLQHFEGQYAARQSHYFDVQTRRFVFVPDEHDDETPRRWRRGLLRRGIFLLTVFCLGWTIYSDPSRVGRWWSTVRGMAQPIIERALDKRTQRLARLAQSCRHQTTTPPSRPQRLPSDLRRHIRIRRNGSLTSCPKPLRRKLCRRSQRDLKSLRHCRQFVSLSRRPSPDEHQRRN